MQATFEGQTVEYDGRSITECHETVDALHNQAHALAPRFARETAEAGCTNYVDHDHAGPRQRRAYELIAQAHCWNEIAGRLEEQRDTQQHEAHQLKLTTSEYRCAVCQENVTTLDIESGQVAEMFDPAQEPTTAGYSFTLESFIVHAECGLARGWEVS
jgi:hypothetical protein